MVYRAAVDHIVHFAYFKHAEQFFFCESNLPHPFCRKTHSVNIYVLLDMHSNLHEELQPFTAILPEKYYFNYET